MNKINDFFFAVADKNFLKVMFGELFNFYLRSNYFFEIHTLYLFIFSFLMCVFATFLIFVNNPIYSVLSLILVYLLASFILVFIEVHFLAVLFILVYLGAVVVLFLFIVMMLNIKVMSPISLFSLVPMLLILSVLIVFFGFIDFSFKSSFNFLTVLGPDKLYFYDFFIFFPLTNLYFDLYNIEVLNYRFERINILAFLLYTHYFVELLLASYVLLLAMVGCIALTLGKDVKDLKKQDTMQQILHSNAFLLRSVQRGKFNY